MTGGLVLGEALNLWIPAEQIIFGLAVWLLFLVCAFARRKSRYRLPVLLFMAGLAVGSLRMEAEQAAFLREEGFFLEEQEDGVVLNGTVRSVKEKDGTLEVVLGDCTSEEENGGLVGRFRRVLCYLEIVEAETNESDSVGWNSESLSAGKRIRVFGEGKAADPARNPGGFDYRLYCRSRGISGIVYADGYAVTGGKTRIIADRLYRIRRSLSERLKGSCRRSCSERKRIWTVPSMNFTGKTGFPTFWRSADFMSPSSDSESGKYSGKAGQDSGLREWVQAAFSASTG